MAIFDQKPRAETRPMQEGENLYRYYDHSARPQIEAKRMAFNLWASYLGSSEAAELRARMMKSTRSFYAAELELVVHEIFRRLKFRMDVHPTAPSGKRFDFLAMKEELSFYIEVTSLLPSIEDEARDNRTAPVINAINRIELPPGHSLSVSVAKSGSSSPSATGIVSAIRKWVAAELPADLSDFPETIISQSDWEFEVTLMNSGSEKVYGRAIGGLSGQATWISPKEDFKEKLESKSTRYGTPELPFLIAVADYRILGTDEEDIFEALYGEYVTIVDRSTTETRQRFSPNGFFGHEARPQNPIISGVLVIEGNPYWASTKPDSTPILYINPFASKPIASDALPFATASIDPSAHLVKTGGKTLSSLLFI